MRYLLSIALASISFAVIAEPDDAINTRISELHAKFATLEVSLKQNQFKHPLVLESSEISNKLKGDIYAVLDYPLNKVGAELSNPDHWCDVLLLHINTKYCHATANAATTSLRVNVGKKTPEELRLVAHIDFNYKVVTITPAYFQIKLDAEDGPLGTSDYLISLEAVATPNAKTLLHLTYSYAMNFGARLAMRTYLKTIASDKVGFTVTGKQPNGQVIYIGGVRGLIERNTMRYYLAIDSFLDVATSATSATAASTEAEQTERRMQNWFTSVERYPRQLHEMDREEYMSMKRAENLRQKTMR